MANFAQSQLDWVIVGWRASPEQYVVLASDQLDQGRLETLYKTEVDRFGPVLKAALISAAYRLEITTKRHWMGGPDDKPLVIMTVGANYVECLLKLMNEWTPESPADQAPALSLPVLAIPEDTENKED